MTMIRLRVSRSRRKAGRPQVPPPQGRKRLFYTQLRRKRNLPGTELIEAVPDAPRLDSIRPVPGRRTRIVYDHVAAQISRIMPHECGRKKEASSCVSDGMNLQTAATSAQRLHFS